MRSGQINLQVPFAAWASFVAELLAETETLYSWLCFCHCRWKRPQRFYFSQIPGCCSPVISLNSSMSWVLKVASVIMFERRGRIQVLKFSQVRIYYIVRTILSESSWLNSERNLQDRCQSSATIHWKTIGLLWVKWPAEDCNSAWPWFRRKSTWSAAGMDSRPSTHSIPGTRRGANGTKCPPWWHPGMVSEWQCSKVRLRSFFNEL